MSRKLAAGTAVVATVAAVGLLNPTAHAAGVPSVSYTGFRNIDHKTGTHSDPMFNQALGINDSGVIAGYAGDPGTDGKPNKGWVVHSPYRQSDFMNENVPQSAQTQVIGINNSGVTVGFWVDSAGDNFGFVKRGSLYSTPTGVTQLLGVNNNGQAVGFKMVGNNAQPVECTFTATSTPTCSAIALPGNPANAQATSINDNGDIAGFITSKSGRSNGYVLAANGTFWQPGRIGNGMGTQIFGINNADTVVGTFTSSTGTHGFVGTAFTGTHQRVDDPNGVGNTVINGLNNMGQIVGFYTGSNNVTHGFLAHLSTARS